MERNTYQKKVVMETVAQYAGRHPAADTIYEAVKAHIPSVSKATVYRILNQAAGQKLIRRVRLSAADRYDDNAAPHYHLCCDECGGVCDVALPFLQGLEERLPPDTEYTVTGHDIIFSGLCPQCANKRM